MRTFNSTWSTRHRIVDTLTLAAIAVMVVANTAGPAAGGPANAGRDKGSQPITDPAVLALAKERGIGAGEAKRRMGWQQKASDVEGALASALGPDRFGGLWIGLDDDRIKVGVVDGVGVQAVASTVGAVATAHGLGDATDVVAVRHSLSALVSANDWIGRQLVRVNKATPFPLQAGYVPDKSVVRLGLPPRPEDLTAAQADVVTEAKRRFGSMLVTYTVTDRVTPEACSFPYCDPPLRAGVRVGPVGCTLGFLARSRTDNLLYAFTAGHCLDGSASTTYWTQFSTGSQHDIGPRHNFVLGADGDAGIIRVTNEPGWSARAWVYVLSSTGNDGVAGTVYDNEYPILADGTSSLNMRICKSGVSSDRTSCGRVKELGVTVTYSTGETINNLARTSYCSLGGDSGVPVYANNTAYGIHVAGSDGCVAYYQGIRGAENLMNVDVSFD